MKTASIPTASLLALLASAAAEPERFFPDDLRQDGVITLSPGFSPDGQSIVFAQSACAVIGDCPQYLKRSEKTADGWSEPRLVDLPQTGRADWPVFLPDGETILFSWAVDRERHKGQNVREDFDLYLLPPGGEPVAIDEPDINRIRGGNVRSLRYVHNEAPGSVTGAGDLYFFSERLDSDVPGERDIYLAPSDGKGGFLRAEPLSAPVNSEGREDTPWVSLDGNLMILTISGRGGEGRSDLFVTRNEGGQWTEPRPLGPAVNSSYDDFGGRLTPDGQYLVFNSTRPFEGQRAGLLQVWWVPVAEVPALR